MTKTLAHLLKSVRVKALTGFSGNPENIEVTGINHDSRKIIPGTLFVAISGFENDGHRYIQQAFERGAVAAIVERIEPDAGPQIQVENSRLAQAEIACAFYDNPSYRLNMTGITGSNGKTTTSLMLRSIMEAAGRRSGLIGTVSYETGKQSIESLLTTPDSPELQSYLAEMLSEGFDTCIMEVSSIGQEQYRNHGIVYDQVCFLNLSREHLDHHGSMEEYFKVKKRLITEAEAETAVILNADDVRLLALATETRGHVLSFGEQNKSADLIVKNLDLSTGFASCELCLQTPVEMENDDLMPFTLPLKLKVAGYHMVMDALAAAGMALAAGIEPETVVRGLEAYRGVERRFQCVYDGAYKVFDDHFANGGNISLTCETLSQMHYEHLHVLYAIRGNRGVTVNRENIQEFSKWKDKLRMKTLTASLSCDCVGHYNIVSPDELAVFKEESAAHGLEYSLEENLDDAVRRVLQLVEAGDVILLAGCQGMDAGARLLLSALAESNPDQKEELFAVLKDRVCGWDRA